MRWRTAVTGLLLCAGLSSGTAAQAADSPWPQLELQSMQLELQSMQLVHGMPEGNLSGLARCGKELRTLSDRDDDRIYRLQERNGELQAVAEPFQAAPAPDAGLSLEQQLTARLMKPLRGGQLDLEGISCDSAGNRYLASETFAAVLQLTPDGRAQWLELPEELRKQARSQNLLQERNGLLEGLAISPDGMRLWLAAERDHRGLLALQKREGRWQCVGSCVLQAEPKAAPQLDFADLAWFGGSLFTLERSQFQMCRRNPDNGIAECCWSLQASQREVRSRHAGAGGAEALLLDAAGAWVGFDNGREPGDDERPSLLIRLAAPPGGWLQ